jgi:hypothetical protein
MKTCGKNGSKVLCILKLTRNELEILFHAPALLPLRKGSQYTFDMKLDEPLSGNDVVAGTDVGTLPGIELWFSSSCPVLY